MKLTTEAEKAIEAIRSIGGRPLLVGGCVRDHLLGVESKDIDIEVHGPVTPDHVAQTLEKIGRVDLVGVSFGVIKFGRDVDVSFPRSDSRVGDGHTGFEIRVDQSMTVEQALSRRDFTINSMAYDPETGEIIDPFDGQGDIRRKTLRHTSEAFAEDPLRVLRAVQFAGRFGFSIYPSTAAICRSLVPRFKELSIERVWMEWWKILTKGTSFQHVAGALVDTGLDVYFPAWDLYRQMDDMIPLCESVDSDVRVIALLAYNTGDLERAEALVQSIGAPEWIARSVRTIVTTPGFEPFDKAAMVRLKAREIAPTVTMTEWLLGWGYSPAAPIWTAAEEQGVMEAPRPRLITGDHLIERGLAPGPLFKPLLQTFTHAQDVRGWTKIEEALEFLDAQFIK
jgi:tRNA nucleotidyltransferase (CCA-adding enzyme)